MIRNILFWEVPSKKYYIVPYLIFLLIVIVLGFIFLNKTYHHNQNSIKWTVFIFGLIFTGLELYKQIFLNVIKKRDGYDWGAFPFQLCSTPIYFCTLSILFKDERKRDFIYAYLGSYAFLGGLSVMVLPMTVFSYNVHMTIHSLIWHALMVVLGIYLIIHHKFGDNLSQYKKATCSFLLVTMLAMLMNFVFEQVKRVTGITDTFNMFFISPYYESHVLIMSDIWRLTNWYVFIFIYIVGIPICALLVWKISSLIRTLILKRKEERA
ncbi:MAG: hypothetical protein ACI32E_03940 [Bacilli bacterium]